MGVEYSLEWKVCKQFNRSRCGVSRPDPVGVLPPLVGVDVIAWAVSCRVFEALEVGWLGS
jgi:hypothetical protein